MDANYREELKARSLEYLKQIEEKLISTNSSALRVKPTTEAKQDFYKSMQWMRLRYATLEKYGAKCSVCSRTAKDGIIIHVDHIIPLSKPGGWERRLDPNGVQVMCGECNGGKLNRFLTDWR